MFTVYGREIDVKLGCYVKPDGWTWGGRLEAETWEMAQFRLPTTGLAPTIKSLAVNVEITGRTLRRMQGGEYIRVKIEFVGDGEPSVFSGGWMKVE